MDILNEILNNNNNNNNNTIKNLHKKRHRPTTFDYEMVSYNRKIVEFASKSLNIIAI